MKIKNIALVIMIFLLGSVVIFYTIKPQTIVTRMPAVKNEKPQLFFEISGSSKSPMKQPMGVTVNSQNKIFVADTGNQQVKIFDENGRYLSAFGKKGSDKGQFQYPYGLVTLPSGNLLVADTVNLNIQEFDKTGKFIKTWIEKSNNIKPGAMAVDKKGKVYVSDLANHQVVVFSQGGTLEKKINNKLSKLQYPQGIFADDNGLIWIADSGHAQIKQINSDGVIKSIILGVNDETPFGMVRGVAIDNMGRIYVSDPLSNQVSVFANDKTLLFSLPGEFYYPMGIYISDDGKIYIINRETGTIQVWGYKK